MVRPVTCGRETGDRLPPTHTVPLTAGPSPRAAATVPGMPFTVEPTPNPNALKFSADGPVGGPATFVAGEEHDDPMASELLALEGVTSVFMTANFVTLSKTSDVSWEDIADRAVEILERRLPDA